jgi:pimeloyl-ACP methyl ester carboxylesterase
VVAIVERLRRSRAAASRAARGHRFLLASAGTVVGLAAAGRVARRLPARPFVPDEELLGSVRGMPGTINGPKAWRIATETIEGQGSGTLVFTHGWCLTEAVWDHQKEALGGRPWSVVTWDLPGHGRSTGVGPGQLTLDLAVESLARVVDRATDGDVILVGHSLGGVLTLRYLATHPETAALRVRGAVVAATPRMHLAGSVAGRWPGAMLESRALGSFMELMVSSSRVDRMFAAEAGTAATTSLSYRVVRTGFGREASPAQVRFVRDLIASVPPSVRLDTYRAMTGYDLSPALAGITVPVTVVLGTRDRLVDPEESRAIAELLPRADLVEFEGAGHAVMLERADAFNEEVAAFARRRFRRASRSARGVV